MSIRLASSSSSSSYNSNKKNDNSNSNTTTATTTTSPTNGNNVTRRQQHHRSASLYARYHLFASFLLGCCVSTVLLSFVHWSTLHVMGSSGGGGSDGSGGNAGAAAAAAVHEHFAIQHLSNKNGNTPKTTKTKTAKDGKQNLASTHDNPVHAVAGLECKEHGGPHLANEASEMVYWRDLPSDNGWTSPFIYDTSSSSRRLRKYLTFEPDGGGWYVRFVSFRSFVL